MFDRKTIHRKILLTRKRKNECAKRKKMRTGRVERVTKWQDSMCVSFILSSFLPFSCSSSFECSEHFQSIKIFTSYPRSSSSSLLSSDYVFEWTISLSYKICFRTFSSFSFDAFLPSVFTSFTLLPIFPKREVKVSEARQNSNKNVHYRNFWSNANWTSIKWVTERRKLRNYYWRWYVVKNITFFDGNKNFEKCTVEWKKFPSCGKQVTWLIRWDFMFLSKKKRSKKRSEGFKII